MCVDVAPMSEGEKQYLHGATHLHLRSGFYLFAFLSQTRKIEKAMAGLEGLGRYELKSNPLSLRFETCSIWEDRRALGRFMALPEHIEATELFHKWASDDSRTVTWTSTICELDWAEAHRRLAVER